LIEAAPGLTATSGLPEGYDRLNRYSQVIVDEALRRRIHVEVLDPSTGELALSAGGRRVTTVESLSELTSAVAFRRCDHKAHTRRVLERAGLRVPPGRCATFDDRDVDFLDRWKDIVVKPARGEGGSGISVGVVDADGLAAATTVARSVFPEVILEQRCEGEDLRVVVIGGEVVAASVRRPPEVKGTGRHTVAELVGTLSDQRSAATAGASKVPLDATTLDVVRSQGYEFDSVLAHDEVLRVRRTANLHTGGTIHDVTAGLHEQLAEVSVRAAEAIDIPVLGLDLIVPAVDGPEYVIIEANEQPGLANHEPQPTVERFVDLLFPA
jgi:GNAT-family acetyltransferase (TIGR03103 family)